MAGQRCTCACGWQTGAHPGSVHLPGLLQALLRVQKLDEHDIEGVHHLYAHVLAAGGGQANGPVALGQMHGRADRCTARPDGTAAPLGAPDAAAGADTTQRQARVSR
jgi:hypothetical protein